MNIVIIKYNAGNIMSVEFALKRLGIQPILTNDPDEIRKADKVIFPGVGEASTTMKHLREKNLDQLIAGLKQPVLGICLGMQLMCSHSEEGNTPCIGIFPETVTQFVHPEKSGSQEETKLKIPQIGWNSIRHLKGELFDHSLEGQYVYFVHSYYVPLSQYTTARSSYYLTYSAALEKDNFFATQFHPEKSSSVGEQILKKFIHL